LGLGYVLARTVGLIFSSRLAAKFTKENKLLGTHLGFAALSHAGAALAIVTKITNEADPSAQAIITVVLSSVFVFEVLGPLILRYTLMHAGEIKIGGMLGPPAARASLSMLELIQNSLENFGVTKKTEIPELESIKLLVDPRVFAINGSASIQEVVQFVDTHHLPIYPVVDDDYNYQGLIQISKIKDVIFDPFHSKFSTAQTLIRSSHHLDEGSKITEAQTAFNLYQTEILPVTKTDSSKLVGTISYKNLIVAMKSSKEDDE